MRTRVPGPVTRIVLYALLGLAVGGAGNVLWAEMVDRDRMCYFGEDLCYGYLDRITTAHVVSVAGIGLLAASVTGVAAPWLGVRPRWVAGLVAGAVTVWAVSAVALATPFQFGMLPLAPPRGAVPVVVLVAFAVVGAALRIQTPAQAARADDAREVTRRQSRRWIGGLLVAALLAGTAAAVRPVRSAWQEHEFRRELHDVPAELLVPDVPGWEVRSAEVVGPGPYSPSPSVLSLSLFLRPVGSPGGSEPPTGVGPGHEWLYVQISQGSPRQQPADCTTRVGGGSQIVCEAVEDGIWRTRCEPLPVENPPPHPACGGSADVTVFAVRNRTAVHIYGPVALDLLLRAARSLRSWTPDAMVPFMRRE